MRGWWFLLLAGLAGATAAGIGEARASDEDCLVCHEQTDLTDEAGRSLAVSAAALKESIHGQAGLACADCHADLAGAVEFPHPERPARVACSGCHAEEDEVYARSIHAHPPIEGERGAGCPDCHESHDVQPASDPRSRVYRANIPLTCASCHAEEPLEAEGGGPAEGKGEERKAPPAVVRTYLRSVHGKALTEKGLIVVAVCIDCHGSHEIRPPSDPASPMHREKVPETCGRCHAGILAQYGRSIHGAALAEGNPDVPVCTDCHGEHTIASHLNPESPVYATNIPRTCSHCHDDMRLNTKYGLPTKRLSTYAGTYHGVASQLGDVRVANCASCHGVHDILPSTDPRSRIHPKRLAATCGRCHPKAGKNFATAKVHVEEVAEQSLGTYLADKFYSLFIPALIGAFVLFIALDLYAIHRRRREGPEEGPPFEAPPSAGVEL